MASVWLCIGGAVINLKQHSDKKPLEGHHKDSKLLHRWFPIEFINEKIYYLIMRNK